MNKPDPSPPLGQGADRSAAAGYMDPRGGAAAPEGKALDTPPNITRPLRALAAFLVVSIIGLTAVQLTTGYYGALDSARRRIGELDIVLARQAGRMIDMFDLVLRSIAVMWRAGQPIDTLNDRLAQRLAAERFLRGAGVIALQRGPDDTAEHDAIRAVAATAAPDQLQIGPAERGADGGWRCYAVLLLPGPDAARSAIAYAVINLDYLQQVFEPADPTLSPTVLLLRRDGSVLLRAPPREGTVNQPYTERGALAAAMQAALLGSAPVQRTLVRPLDGTARLVALHRVRADPLVLTVSVSRSMVLRPWRRSALVFGVIALLASAAIGLLIRLLGRRSREMHRTLDDLRASTTAADAANRHLRREMAEREQAEAALREAQRAEAIGQLTRGVAHDFNNLLAVVIGNIDLMAITHGADPAAMRRLSAMREAAERGATLTGQLMAFARRQPLQPRAADLNEVATEMQPLLASAVGSRIRIEYDLAADLPPAQVDPTQIELAILNLAINARDAMSSGGVLTIATARTPLYTEVSGASAQDGVALIVRDTGPGMAPEIRAKAFEPFFTTKGPGRGSGLGLSQVHGLAYQSGGSVHLESATGAGTRVEIRLPLAAGHAPAAAPAPPQAGTIQQIARVLLVDDDGPVRETAAAVLAAQGHLVTEAADGATALGLVRDGGSFDVLVTDVVMPGLSGPELVRALRDVAPDLPVVLISGYTEPEDLAASATVSHFVRKPFTPQALSGAIEAALHEAARRFAPAEG